MLYFILIISIVVYISIGIIFAIAFCDFVNMLWLGQTQYNDILVIGILLLCIIGVTATWPITGGIALMNKTYRKYLKEVITWEKFG